MRRDSLSGGAAKAASGATDSERQAEEAGALRRENARLKELHEDELDNPEITILNNIFSVPM